MGAYYQNYLAESTDLMRLLFETVAEKKNIDFEFFVSNFMRSKYRQLMDIGSTRIINMTYDELLSYLENDNRKMFKKASKISIDVLQAGWIGTIYNIIQFQTKLSSKEIYNIINLDKMMSYFRTFHTIDENLAVERIIKTSIHGK